MGADYGAGDFMHKIINSRWGTCKFFSKDEYVGKSLYYYGEYNPDETEKILELATPAKLCLDIGANIGCISQALLANGHSVLAFEPQPEVFKVLSFNVGERNCVNTAVGSGRGTALMPKVHYSTKGNFGGLAIGDNSIYGQIVVDMLTIDSLDLPQVGLIKLDVEGFELDALKGAKNTISKYKPVMYVEDDRLEKSRKLRDYITSLGYKITEHKPMLYRENNYAGLKRNVWNKNYASHNLICTPC